MITQDFIIHLDKTLPLLLTNKGLIKHKIFKYSAQGPSYGRSKKNRLAHFKIGNAYTFLKGDILAWMRRKFDPYSEYPLVDIPVKKPIVQQPNLLGLCCAEKNIGCCEDCKQVFQSLLDSFVLDVEFVLTSLNNLKNHL